MKRLVLEAEHEQLRETANRFIESEVTPNAERWEQERRLPGYITGEIIGAIAMSEPGAAANWRASAPRQCVTVTTASSTGATFDPSPV